jgi:hypothetical protein
VANNSLDKAVINNLEQISSQANSLVQANNQDSRLDKVVISNLVQDSNQAKVKEEISLKAKDRVKEMAKVKVLDMGNLDL